MNTLIVTAHPSSKGNTHKIAEVYAAESEAFGRTARIMDLYSDEWKQDFLAFEDVREFNERATYEKIRQQLDWAEELVFICPMWWGGFPARMKNFFDQNLMPGHAYTYKNAKMRGITHLPKGLFVGKRVRVIMTADGPQLGYALFKPFFTTAFRIWVVQFTGMKLASFTIIGDMRLKKQKDGGIETMLKRIKKLVK